MDGGINDDQICEIKDSEFFRVMFFLVFCLINIIISARFISKRKKLSLYSQYRQRQNSRDNIWRRNPATSSPTTSTDFNNNSSNNNNTSLENNNNNNSLVVNLKEKVIYDLEGQTPVEGETTVKQGRLYEALPLDEI